MTLKNKVFLASKSPRRRELILQVFENTETIDAPLDEPRWKSPQKPADYLELCLEEKFRVGALVLPAASESSLLLVADTIVVRGKSVLGKPTDSQDAVAMLQELSGSWHSVFTGIKLGILKDGEWLQKSVHVESRVKFRNLSTAEIKDYVRSREPMDKAGSYGFQAKGLQLVDKIQGSYTNIIGLPVLELEKLARQLIAST